MIVFVSVTDREATTDCGGAARALHKTARVAWTVGVAMARLKRALIPMLQSGTPVRGVSTKCSGDRHLEQG
jgi:hypothetical protein